MRIPRDQIHPSLLEPIERVRKAMLSGAPTTAAERDAYTRNQSLWLNQNAYVFLVAMVLLFGGIGFSVSLKAIYGKQAVMLALLAVFALCAGLFMIASGRSRRWMSLEELKLFLPALRLTPIQRAYGETLLSLAELNLPEDMATDLTRQLHALLDEEARLLAIRERGEADPVTPQQVMRERDDLVRKLEGTTDTMSREALERSIEICEGRISAARDLSVVVQRVDAQLAMLDQTMRGLRDTLQRLHAAPMQGASALDLSPIRQTVLHAQQHASALEAAVSEVQGLR